MDAIYEGQGGRLLLLDEISATHNDAEFLKYLVENYLHAACALLAFKFTVLVFHSSLAETEAYPKEYRSTGHS